jgi:hypothetical protein
MSYGKFILLSILLVSCDTIVDPKPVAPDNLLTVTAEGITYSLSIPRVDFAMEDTLIFTYTVVNTSDSVRTYGFMNQQQMGYQFKDMEGNAKATYPMLFQPAGSSIILQPDERKEFSVKTPLRQEYPNSLQRGEYRLSVFLLDNNSPKVYARITIQ